MTQIKSLGPVAVFDNVVISSADPITASPDLAVTFDKFDPSLGTLNSVRITS